MTRLRVSFEIVTDGDPSSVLDGAVEALPSLIEHIEATGAEIEGDQFDYENEVTVEEVKP